MLLKKRILVVDLIYCTPFNALVAAGSTVNDKMSLTGAKQVHTAQLKHLRNNGFLSRRDHLKRLSMPRLSGRIEGPRKGLVFNAPLPAALSFERRSRMTLFIDAIKCNFSCPRFIERRFSTIHSQASGSCPEADAVRLFFSCTPWSFPCSSSSYFILTLAAFFADLYAFSPPTLIFQRILSSFGRPPSFLF